MSGPTDGSARTAAPTTTGADDAPTLPIRIRQKPGRHRAPAGTPSSIATWAGGPPLPAGGDPMSGRIRRTDKDPFGMGGLANAPAFPGAPGFGAYIEAQEAQGQREVVESTDLPSNAYGRDDDFVALGFTFGEPHERDPLFRPATLPAGWKREGSDHAMWSHIVDDQGRRRVSIFYKAAYYDRDAFMSLVHPTSRLTDLIYGDDEPTSVPLDDLLSAEDARAYLEKEHANAVHYAGLGLDRADKVARIDAMLALLPEVTR